MAKACHWPQRSPFVAGDGWICRAERAAAPRFTRSLSRQPAVERRAAGGVLACAERLEGDDGVGVLNARNDLHLLVDEMADVGVVVDVELDQQIVVAGGGIDLRGDLGFRERVGDGVGLAELAFELDEEGNHRCRLRKSWPNRPKTTPQSKPACCQWRGALGQAMALNPAF